MTMSVKKLRHIPTNSELELSVMVVVGFKQSVWIIHSQPPVR